MQALKQHPIIAWLPLTVLGVLPASVAQATLGPCTGDRYLGIVATANQCKGKVGNWAKSRLFPGAVPEELRRYCVVRWTGLNPPVNPPPAFPGGEGPTLDCAVVSPYATDFAADNQAALEASFRSQAEGLTELPVATNSSPTKVMVIDSSLPTGFPVPSDGLIEHGKMVGMVIRELSCPYGSPVCAGAVASTLAFPLYRDGTALVRDPVNGGHFGSFGDIATAIVSAVQIADTQPGPTVLNLSLGWDPGWGGDYVGDDWRSLSPAIRAVHVALTWAVCKGALPIAAAGNAPGGLDQVLGASFPGEWETKPAPSPDRCNDLGIPPPVVGPTTAYRRLVYAVGAVDPRDNPLPNSRPLGLPPLVAPGDHASISNVVSGEKTSVYTGSSVATAVASAAAAAIWRYNPLMSTHDVMEQLRISGYDLLLAPELELESCGAGGCPATVHRISICRAVARACNFGQQCTAPVCDPPSSPRDDRPTNLVFTLDASSVSIPQPVLTSLGPASPPCEGEAYGQSAATSPACPAQNFENAYARPYSGPQPEGTVCVTCLVKQQKSILELNKGFEGALYEPTLILTPLVGDKKLIPLTIDPVDLVAGKTIEVTDLPFDAAELKSATVDFKVELGGSSYSSSDPLIISP